MPGKIKVKILAGRNLPVMDRSGDTTDAYVELKFGNITYKTDVCRKSLNPQWNSEWYKFEVDDAELQDEPLQIRLMDHDTYSANDAIGKVYINLNPLLLHGILPPLKNIWTLEATINTSTSSQGSHMKGWIPVYDTMHGIRGEVNIILKVELFSDFNKFRQSSCGVQFFYSPNIPYGYHAQMIHGFVEELVVSDDPEYKWIDKIRTPRASNEARQTLFFKLSGEVQRKIGLKALDLGGNAVIGYLQNFDLEGESGIVARGIGTVVTLVKLHDVLGFPCDNVNIEEIAFALSSRTKVQIEYVEADDNVPLIPISIPTPIPASYPMRIHRVPADKNFPFYIRASSSLTRLERAKKVSGTPEHVKTRRCIKQFPVLRSNTSSTLDLNTTCSNLDLTRSGFLIDETARSLRNMLMSENTKRDSSRDRLSKQIKHLRSKFDSVKETYSAVKSDSDVDLVRSFTVNARNPKMEKGFKDANTTGTIMTALLIGSIQNMPLDNSINADSTSVSCSNEQLNDEINHHPKEDTENNDEDQKIIESTSSTVDEKEISALDNDNSTDDDLSDDSAVYNILNNSRYSLDKDSDNKIEDSLTFQEKTPITCSSANSCTDSTLQIDSDVSNRLSSTTNLTSTMDIRLRKDEIPIITVNADKITDSNTSIDASELSIDENQYNDSSSYESQSVNLAKSNIFILKPIHSSSKNEDDINQVIKTISDTSIKHREASSDIGNRRSLTSECNGLSQVNPLHFSRRERHLSKARSRFIQQNRESTQSMPSINFGSLSSTEINDHTNIGEQRNELAVDTALDLPHTTKDSNIPYEKLCTIANIERRKRMHDLIKLIDTKMMVPTHHGKNIVSSTRKSKKHKKMRKIPSLQNLFEKFSFHNISTKKRISHRRQHGKGTSHIPRVYSTPEYLSSVQHPIISSYATSHSCNCSLNNLINISHTCVSSTSKRVIVSMTDNQFDASEISARKSLTDIRSDPDTVPSTTWGTRKSTNTNHSSFLSPDITVAAIRKCNSVCNLGKTFYHIDCAKPTNSANMTYNSCVSRPSPGLRQQDEASVSPSYPFPAVPSMGAKASQSPATKALINVQTLHRRSSDSDLSVTPKGNSLGSSDKSMGGPLRTSAAVVRPMNQDTLEMLEYPFITMQHYPPGFILRIGGLVSSRSVKLLERISNLEEPESRDAWWTEIRMEVRSHARALACNVVIGYKEETSICDDVCVLSASGTAAVISFHNSAQDPDGIILSKFQQSMPTPAELDREKSQQKLMKAEKTDNDTTNTIRSERQSGKTSRHYSESNDHEESYNQSPLRCNLCHLPYNENSVPFRINVSKCAICKRAKVPDIMFTTIEVPPNIPTTGRGCFIQATVCKSKKDLRGELNAKEISDCLPFLEYELHSLLLNKLKVKGMNAIFGLRLQVSVGERLIIGMAVGTALYLTALPPPTIPQIASGNSWHNEEQLANIQKSIIETVKKNREFYHLKPTGCNETENGRIPCTSDTDSDEDLPELDLGLGTRDTCILEVDDIEDMDRISLLVADDRPPDDFHVVNTQTIPGLEDLEIVRNLQMFTQISRTKIPAGQFASVPSKYFAHLLQSLYFKLRRMVPCALCDMQFKIALSEQDEIQLTVVGMALGLGEALKTDKYKRKIVCHSLSKDQVKKSDDNDMIFNLEEDHVESNVISENAGRTCTGNLTSLISAPMQKPRPRSPLRSKTFTSHRHKHVPLKGTYGVDITPLSYLPGGRIEKYQGNLNFFFIRESTSIRENGGLSSFIHSFVMEVLAIVRAHITALGGNAMVAFFMTQCVLLHSPHKNQGQCLINVGGDVVTVSYYADEKHNTVSNY